MRSICPWSSSFRVPPPASRLPPPASGLPPTAYRLPPTALLTAEFRPWHIPLFIAKYAWLATVRRPVLVHFEVTMRCNARCGFCDYWKTDPSAKASELKSFADAARYFNPALITFTQEMDQRALAAELALGAVEVGELTPPAIDRLGELTVPVLVTAGAADVPDIRRLADRIAAEVPGAVRLPDVPDAAHLLPLERPEPVNAALLDFLS